MAYVVAPSQVRIHSKVTARWKWIDPGVITRHISRDSTTMSVLTNLAKEVAGRARSNMGNSPIPAKTRGKSIDYHRMTPPTGPGQPWTTGAGWYWSSRPVSVQRGVRVKDAGKAFKYKYGGNVDTTGWSLKDADLVAVALAVADHPYSASYEYGGFGIKSKSFMRNAARMTAAKHVGVKYKASDKPRGMV